MPLRKRVLYLFIAVTAFFMSTAHYGTVSGSYNDCSFNGWSYHQGGWFEAQTDALGYCKGVRAQIGYYDAKGKYRFQSSYRLTSPWRTSVRSSYTVSDPVFARHDVKGWAGDWGGAKVSYH